jgi:transposase
MIDQRTRFELHRLAPAGLSGRKIAKTLGISRPTATKSLEEPPPPRPQSRRASKREAFKDERPRLWELAPQASAGVIRPPVATQGFDGGRPRVRASLHGVRDASKKQHPVLRFESAPGGQCQTDGGHFGSLT